ncbi:unnamed protein product [Schistocephalus solidus]|uniref:Endo/exonuclease/phosphatase domain-containing protein n=1 Tax=Schistocephalus solidus TaxID=70667 RepID=A0A183SI27_SCHSO|nr:unnamed protein product [Schistocephalus solidus]
MLTWVVLPLKQNRDPSWSSVAIWDVRAALFRDSTACILAEEGDRKGALNKCWVSRLLRPAAARRSQNTLPLNSNKQKYHRPYPLRHYLQSAKVSPLTLAAWNIHSLLANPRSNRPERRTALVARELARYKVDIAVLSETRFSEQGRLQLLLEQPAKGRATRL